MIRILPKFLLVLALTLISAQLTYATSPMPAPNRAQVLGSWVAFTHPNYYFLELSEDGKGFFAVSYMGAPTKVFRVVGWSIDEKSVLLPLAPTDSISEKYPELVRGSATAVYRDRFIIEIKEGESSKFIQMFREKAVSEMANSIKARIKDIRSK